MIHGFHRSQTGRTRRLPLARLLRVAPSLPLAVLVLLAACTSPRSDAFLPPPRQETTTAQVPVMLAAALPDLSGDFDRPTRARVAAFLDEFRERGNSPLRASVSAPDAAGAARTAAAVKMLGQRRGLAEGALVISDRTGSPPYGVTFHYTDLVVIPPTCLPETAESRTPDNAVSPNFGCSMERSLASMLARPADLLSPTAQEGADGARLGRVIEHYRQGKATQSEAERNEESKASKLSLNK
jgi:pilus assembly protein CpaD